MFNYIIFGAIVAIYVATHGKFHQSSSQSASYVFLCLTFEFLFFMIKNSNQDDKLCIFHIPCINHIIGIKKSQNNFLNQHIAFIYLFQTTIVRYHHWKAPKKNFYQVETKVG